MGIFNINMSECIFECIISLKPGLVPTFCCSKVQVLVPILSLKDLGKQLSSQFHIEITESSCQKDKILLKVSSVLPLI